jgi:prepilin-type N-terminal cleavage/methylation domain-containing protein
MKTLSPATGQKGFSLIEVLIAVALGALLLLVAANVFRTATLTMSTLNVLAEENCMIRAGYFTAINEVDYWHTEANPAFPYLRGHAIEVADNPDNPDEADSIYGARPFAPVEWSDSLDDPHNPNWKQPHDPRAFYRNNLTPNVVSGSFQMLDRKKSASTSEIKTSTGFLPDYLTSAQPDRRMLIKYLPAGQDGGAGVKIGDYLGTVRNELPVGWKMWHLAGDYAALSNIDGFSNAAGDNALGTNGYVKRHDHPQQFINTFQELGLTGIFNYQPPGTLNMVLASSINLSANRVGDASYNSQRGEIPWSFQTDAETINFGTITPTTSHLQGETRLGDDAYDLDKLSKVNYHALMPSNLDALRAPYKMGPTLSVATDLDTISTDSRVSTHFRFRMNPIGMISERYRAYIHTDSARPIMPMGLLYPPTPFFDPTVTDSDFGGEASFSQADTKRTMINPLFLLNATAPQLKGYRAGGDTSTAELRNGNPYPSINLDTKHTHSRLRDSHRSTTWHIPQNHTDSYSPQLTETTGAKLKMGTRIFRYRFNRQDKAEVTVVVQNPRTQETMEFRFNTFSTDFRGARQYWGRASSQAAIPVAQGASKSFTLGDTYD